MEKTFKWGDREYTIEAIKWGAAKRYWALVLKPSQGNAYETLEELLKLMNCPQEVLDKLDDLYDSDVSELIRILRVTHFPQTAGEESGGNPDGGGLIN